MLVQDWMTSKVITVDAGETLSEAINILKRNKIRRLPVLKDGQLVGIVSDRDIKEASPSKATSLDIWELHYLMSKIKVKDIMTRKPITIHPHETIEKAAIIMHDKKIGGLPVVTEEGELTGILTEQDIFDALISITGARLAKYRVCVIIPDEPGSVKEVCDKMRAYQFKCISILTTHHSVAEGKRKVVIRFQADEQDVPKIVNALKAEYSDVLFTEDENL